MGSWSDLARAVRVMYALVEKVSVVAERVREGRIAGEERSGTDREQNAVDALESWIAGHNLFLALLSSHFGVHPLSSSPLSPSCCE